MKKSCRVHILLAIVAVFVVVLVVGCASDLNNLKQAEGVQEEYTVVKTKYITIRAKPSEFSEIKRCLEIKNFEELDVFYEEVFNFLKKRLGLGYEKAALNPVRVGVMIYSSFRQLDKVYESLGGKQSLIKGFYAGGFGAIYTSLWYLNREHINHEFAHHILKRELGLNLPEKEEEYLAKCAGEFL
jgi:hypothetical protein